MIDPKKIFGRLGNSMFQYAFLYAYSKRHGGDWYFQDPKWFEEYEKDIKKLFGTGIGYDDRVAIHVRRAGNPVNLKEPAYSENPFMVDLTKTEYYERAMAMFPKERFLIFSDDLPWCKERFKGCDFSDNDEVEDLNRMASCKSQIIANSSYSWWAAYLNPNPNKKVIYPSKWYADGIKRTVCSTSWIAI